MYEMPPILRGSAQEQINALRDYLVRLAERISKLEDEIADSARKQG